MTSNWTTKTIKSETIRTSQSSKRLCGHYGDKTQRGRKKKKTSYRENSWSNEPRKKS